MKRLIVSLKTADEVFADFKKAFSRAKKSRKPAEPHFEISFDNKKDFERFVKNIQILSYIITFKPKSIYELAKIARMDVSNLNKVILFFEEVGAVKLKESKVSGRTVKTPTVEYDKVEFDLVA
jgi:predicted transcriptional regulator